MTDLLVLDGVALPFRVSLKQTGPEIREYRCVRCGGAFEIAFVVSGPLTSDERLGRAAARHLELCRLVRLADREEAAADAAEIESHRVEEWMERI